MSDSFALEDPGASGTLSKKKQAERDRKARDKEKEEKRRAKRKKAEARRRSSKIWSDRETLREERRQSKAAPTTKRERVLEQLRARSLAVCESSKFMTFMTVLTLYALFGDDAKLCLADSTADDAFVVAAVVCIVCFFVEIVLQCFAYAWYFRGFYFWVDLASTLSILTEIPAVMAEVAILVGGSGGESAEMLKAGKVLGGVLFRSSDLSATFVRFRGRSDRAVAATVSSAPTPAVADAAVRAASGSRSGSTCSECDRLQITAHKWQVTPPTCTALRV